ncbi:MAG: copper resistance protein CopC [Chloroflexi bacterium]|nr:copper resistance protein CopC [Chloroflexota bacterium]MCI0577271.1 copper resistance protein CopC [Chloroflexota bacterium]
MMKLTFFLAFFLLLGLLLGRRPGAANAHSELVAARPAPGEQLAAAPAEIRLTFNQPLAPGSTFVVFGAGFRQVPDLIGAIDPQAPEQLFAAVPALAPDTYTVQWTSVSNDGDTLSGSYSFRLATAPGSAEGAGFSGRWILAGALAVVLLGFGAWHFRKKLHLPWIREGTRLVTVAIGETKPVKGVVVGMIWLTGLLAGCARGAGQAGGATTTPTASLLGTVPAIGELIGTPAATIPPLPTLDPAEIALGRAVYGEHCAACHGVNLEGHPNWQEYNEDGSFRPPPHDATGHTWHHSDSLLIETIRLGGERLTGNLEGLSNMPPFGEVLSDEEIAAVLAFIKSTWPEETRQFQWEATVIMDNQ